MSFTFNSENQGEFKFKLLFDKTFINLSNLFSKCSNLLEVNFIYMDFTDEINEGKEKLFLIIKNIIRLKHLHII